MVYLIKTNVRNLIIMLKDTRLKKRYWQLTDIVGICVEGCSFGGGVSRRVLAEFIRAILKQKERTRLLIFERKT